MKNNNEQLYEMETVSDVAITMRDGITLYGDLYQCKTDKPCPVILCRYIFRKEDFTRHWAIYEPSYFVKRGYHVFIQDIRGTGKSEGEFLRFTADGKDGYDTIEWLAEQSWCDGNVGMFGNFYAGFLQFAAAYEQPPHLKAICPFQTNVTLNRNNNTRGFLFASHVGWCMSRIIERLKDGWYDQKTVKRMLPLLENYFDSYMEQVMYRPLAEMPAANIHEFPLLNEYMVHLVKGYDNLDLIHKEGKDMDLSRINVPVLGCAGWFDDSRNSTIEQFVDLKEKGEGLAKESEIIIGPWEPGENLTVYGVDLDFGKSCEKSQQFIARKMLHWFDRWLKGIAPIEPNKPVRMFRVGLNDWEETDSWPITDTKEMNLYLSSRGHANTRFGDGRLTFKKGKHIEETDSYLYNPERLIYSQPMGKDHSKLEEREDILVYTSEELKEDILVTGLIEAKLFISSSAADTDFMVKILDMPENDKAIAITEGATRAKYRNSWSVELLKPNEVYEISVKAGYVNYSFKKGHKIRIEIASSNFMKFDYNHNTGKRVEYDADIVCAANTIHHSGSHLSKIVLPVRVK